MGRLSFDSGSVMGRLVAFSLTEDQNTVVALYVVVRYSCIQKLTYASEEASTNKILDKRLDSF
jgi:hypothetical protein